VANGFTEECHPADMTEAYAIQRLVFAELGRAAAWKVGAGSPDATPAYAAIADATLFADGAVLPSNMFNLVGIEARSPTVSGAIFRHAHKPIRLTRSSPLSSRFTRHRGVGYAFRRLGVRRDRPSHVAIS